MVPSSLTHLWFCEAEAAGKSCPRSEARPHNRQQQQPQQQPCGAELSHRSPQGQPRPCPGPARAGRARRPPARPLHKGGGQGWPGGRARAEGRAGASGGEAARREGSPAAGSGAPRWDWFLRSHFPSNQTADLRREPTRAALEVCAWLRPMIGNRFHCRLE